MAALSTYSVNVVLDNLLYNKVGLYAALFTSSTGLVTNAPTGEVSTVGTGYTRMGVSFGVHANGTISPSVQILFPIAGISWGTITHWAVMDAATGGNVIVWAPLTTPSVINAGDLFLQRADLITLTAV